MGKRDLGNPPDCAHAADDLFSIAVRVGQLLLKLFPEAPHKSSVEHWNTQRMEQGKGGGGGGGVV